MRSSRHKKRRGPPPIAVVLGAGIDENGKPAEATLLRTMAAWELAKRHREIEFIILSGDGPLSTDRHVSEAAAMADVLEKNGVDRSRLFLEDESVDTIGNAVLTAARYLHKMRPRTLYLVTSPFHMERAMLTFQHTLSREWNIVAWRSAAASDDAEREFNEYGGIQWAKAFFLGIDHGDLPSIIQRLQRDRPYYATLPWLRPRKYKRKLRHRIWCRLRKCL
jgi:hypothetical protein